MQTRRSAAATQAARCGVCGRASLEAADGDDLVPGPDSDGEGAGPAVQDGVRAVVERLKGWDCFTLSPRRPYEEYKRMVLEHTHGLFIT